MLFKLVTVSLLSIASARTLRTSEDPAPVKIEDMAKFVGVSAKSEEASTKGGPVDWPPAGIGDVSRKKPVFKQLPGTQSNVQVARESNCRSIRVPTPMVFYGRWRRWFLRRWQHDMALFFCRSQKSRLNNASSSFLVECSVRGANTTNHPTRDPSGHHCLFSTRSKPVLGFWHPWSIRVAKTTQAPKQFTKKSSILPSIHNNLSQTVHSQLCFFFVVLFNVYLFLFRSTFFLSRNQKHPDNLYPLAKQSHVKTV